MSLAAVIARRATHLAVVVSRPGVATATLGRAVAGAATTLTVDLVVQPLGGDELKRLPEGRLASEVCSLWCVTALLLGDRMDLDGATWEVEDVNDRAVDGGFHRAQARKVIL